MIKVKLGTDGQPVEELADGSTRPLVDKTDWLRLQAMSDAEVTARALGDPDAQPPSLGTYRSAPIARLSARVPRTKTLRRALSLTQEEFAARYHIPLGTLRDWEQGRCAPDQPARAYLTVIAHDPEGVARTLTLHPSLV